MQQLSAIRIDASPQKGALQRRPPGCGHIAHPHPVRCSLAVIALIFRCYSADNPLFEPAWAERKIEQDQSVATKNGHRSSTEQREQRRDRGGAVSDCAPVFFLY
jgi:hypothetical protein